MTSLSWLMYTGWDTPPGPNKTMMTKNVDPNNLMDNGGKFSAKGSSQHISWRAALPTAK